VLRRQLQQFPEAVQAIIQAAHALRKPVTHLSGNDVGSWANKVAQCWRPAFAGRPGWCRAVN